MIANSLPAKDPEIKGATRIEIEFEYLCEIKSKKGIMKVDYECLREAKNPKVWAISDAGFNSGIDNVFFGSTD